MSMPGFTAADAATRPTTRSDAPPQDAPIVWGDVIVPAAMSGALVPQFPVCTPCLGLPPGPWCFTVFGRRICLPIPNIGSWKGCCEVNFRWGWPPVTVGSCRVERCA